MKANFLKLNIYYETLQVDKYEEMPLYDDYQLASDMGMYVILSVM